MIEWHKEQAFKEIGDKHWKSTTKVENQKQYTEVISSVSNMSRLIH